MAKKKKDKDHKIVPVNPLTLSDEEAKEFQLEEDQLPAGSLYIVLTPRDLNNFALKIHDSTEGEFYTRAHILVKGLLETMEKSLDDVMAVGEEVMKKEFGEPDYTATDNVISVDFSGKKSLH